MIFATVGTQLPFDRMIGVIDKWSIKQGVKDCFAQVGKAGSQPANITSAPNLTPLQFAKRIAECKVIVSHAGMGTILTAFAAEKPIIVMPRLAAHGEHRNDHQLATVANLRDRAGIYVADDEVALADLLDQIKDLRAASGAAATAEPALLAAIGDFIAGAPAWEGSRA